MGMLTIQGASGSGGWVSLLTLCWWYFAHFGWWVSHGDDILTPESRWIGCVNGLGSCY